MWFGGVRGLRLLVLLPETLAMVHSILRWVLSISCLGLGGCGSDASLEPAAAPPGPAAAARAVFDLEATMTALVATLERRTELCRLALRDPDAFGRNEADEFVDAQYEEFGLVRSIRVQMKSEPTWTPRICEWFDAVLRKPNEENVVIESKAFGRDSDRFDWNDVVRIYGDEYASRGGGPDQPELPDASPVDGAFRCSASERPVRGLPTRIRSVHLLRQDADDQEVAPVEIAQAVARIAERRNRSGPPLVAEAENVVCQSGTGDSNVRYSR